MLKLISCWWRFAHQVFFFFSSPSHVTTDYLCPKPTEIIRQANTRKMPFLLFFSLFFFLFLSFFFVLFWRTHPAVLKNYSWINTQRSFLAGLEETCLVLKMKPWFDHMQGNLYTIFLPWILHFMMLREKKWFLVGSPSVWSCQILSVCMGFLQTLWFSHTAHTQDVYVRVLGCFSCPHLS